MSEPAGLSANSFRYDKVTISLHWLTVILVALLWLGAQVIDFFPRGGGRVEVRSVHILLGATLAAVIVLRLLWRKTPWGSRRPVRRGLGDLAAHALHTVLILLVGATVLLGLFNLAVRGDAVFTWMKLPPLGADIAGLRNAVGEWHGFAANIVLAVAGLHAAAALVHHFLLRDDTLRRMRPGAA